MAAEATADLPTVSVVSFTGLLVDCVRELGGVTAVVKGLRLMTDFEYELQQANLGLSPLPRPRDHLCDGGRHLRLCVELGGARDRFDGR